MAKGPGYKVPFRRRREGKTNYHLRRKLILSEKTRFVVRRTLKHVIVQFINAKPSGDVVSASAHSKELSSKYGWMGSCKNTPAAYLTGMLAGFRALRRGINEAILDAGLYTCSKGSRVFAALKGAVDAGVTIPVNEGKLPDEKRIRGEHIAGYAVRLSSNPKRYDSMFSGYLTRGLKPEELPGQVERVKGEILKELKPEGN
jgi:large subunit ribosomal protein L18